MPPGVYRHSTSDSGSATYIVQLTQPDLTFAARSICMDIDVAGLMQEEQAYHQIVPGKHQYVLMCQTAEQDGPDA
ncbi:hypothetical protein MHL40_13610 [Pseudomonas luteola]|uniref:hypothetical protein n=1 Tax=Pseudomonas luteola TaxID=47886 RepID=UPI001EF3D9C9|nr:hypothetical protein [Pseudomonas luteola]MCG7373701.1 hypothetical protein [Pseudomonas luteola]